MNSQKTQPTNSSADQDELLEFLERPASYPYGPPSVTVVQTHAAYVALAPPYVYKVKKPVDMGFLDFSTLRKRRHYTQREVELNRRLCPDIYLGVVPIVARDEGLTFAEDDETGEVVDYAVKMRLLDRRFFLDRLLQEDKVSPADLDRVVAKLIPFYAQQEPSEEVTRNGRPEVLEEVIGNNLKGAQDFVGQSLNGPTLAALRYFNDRFFAGHAALLRSRTEQQWIKDGHGDLHREHIHLGPDCVCIYDCIEFNDKFRYLDVVADVAFLAMDLDFAGRRDLSRYFVDQMSRALHDEEMLELIDFYKCYRAAVRGKVESLRASEEEVPDDRREASQRRARQYYQLALNYAGGGAEPTVLVVMGRIASGKSTVASALGEALGWPVFSSDRLRKEIAGLPVKERPAPEKRRMLYTEGMSKRTYARLNTLARANADQGESVILDATFGQKQYRDGLRDALAGSGVAVSFIELTTPDATVKDRLRQRADRTDVISDARLEDFDMLARSYEAPDELSEAELQRVDGEQAMDRIVEEVYHVLIERRMKGPAGREGNLRGREYDSSMA